MKMIIIGYGAVSSAFLPILISELKEEITSLKIIAPHIENKCTIEHGITINWHTETLTRENYKSILNDLDEQTFLVNLSVDVASLQLISLCHEAGALYLDTCIEPWAGQYTDSRIDLQHRTNYSLRDRALAKSDFFEMGLPQSSLTGQTPAWYPISSSKHYSTFDTTCTGPATISRYAPRMGATCVAIEC